jgi:hypothetical protein
MQDDREIRARGYKYGKNENKSGTVNHQPIIQPDLQYTRLNLFGGEPVQHRGSLSREEPTTTAVTEQNQGSKNHDPKSENQPRAEHSKYRHGHKTLHKTPKINVNEHQPKGKGRMAYNYHESCASNRSTCTDPPAYPDHEDRNAILVSRQTWRHQNLSGKQEGCPECTLAACSGDWARGSENHDPVTPRHPVRLSSYSKDASVSQVRGKRILKQLAKVEGNTARSTTINASESLTDELVLVFYDDGDHPQRHRLADCARLRAATLGRTGTPHHNDLPASWREEKIVCGNGQPEASKLNNLAAYREVLVIEQLKSLNPQHILKDCAAGDNSKAEDVKQDHCESQSLDACASGTTNSGLDAKYQSLQHSLQGCTGDITTTTKDPAQPDLSPDSIKQNRLDDCPTDIAAVDTNPEPAGEISQHYLAVCTEKIPDLRPATPAILDRHAVADCAVVVDAQISEPRTLDHHDLADCAITGESQSTEASDDIYSGPKVHSHISHDHSRSTQTAEQNESRTVTITVPQPPVIIVTTSDVLEEAISEQLDHTRSKSLYILIISNDSTTSTEYKAGHQTQQETTMDPPMTIHNGEQQLSEAADALRKVLRAAADARHGKTTTEFEGNEPTVVDANSSAKRSSHRSRGKAIGGRAQKNKRKQRCSGVGNEV